MMQFLLETYNLPYTLAVVLLLVVLLLEVAGVLLAGFGMVSSIEDVLTPSDGASAGILSFLHFGKVPLLALMALFLGTFAVTGYLFQVVTGPLPLLVTVPCAVVSAFLMVRLAGGRLAAYIRTDEPAPSQEDLLGLEALIQTGTSRAGHPAQARVVSAAGTTHYVMVEPENDEDVFEVGTAVVLVSNTGIQFRGRRQGLRIG